jgi:hypothetical protein
MKVKAMKEKGRAAWGWRWLEDLTIDLRTTRRRSP